MLYLQEEKLMLHNSTFQEWLLTLTKSNSEMKAKGGSETRRISAPACPGASDLQNKRAGWQFGWCHCPLLAAFSITSVLSPAESWARCTTQPSSCSISCSCEVTAVVSLHNTSTNTWAFPQALHARILKHFINIHWLFALSALENERRINSHSWALTNNNLVGEIRVRFKTKLVQPWLQEPV